MIGPPRAAALLLLLGASPMIAQRDEVGEATTPWGSRRYTVHLPPERFGTGRPVVLVLHGCLQDAAQIAAGTRFSAAADSLGFIVIYPEQSQSVNPFRCWQWYDAAHQARGAGEPAILAELARSTARQYAADTARIHVAGISAGGAMAVNLLASYPDVFAAGAVQAAVPYKGATNVFAGAALMRSGAGDINALADSLRKASPAAPRPLFVMHGARDTIVVSRNGRLLADQWVRGFERATGRRLGVDSMAVAFVGAPWTAYDVQAREFRDGTRLVMQHLIVRELGHAWSGGSKEGSYIDPAGPPATSLILQFFGLEARRP